MPAIIKYKLYYWLDRYLGTPLCFLLSWFTSPKVKKEQAYTKILVIKLGMLGDAILLIPALRALREKFHNAHIVILCSEANLPIFLRCPYINEYMVIKFPDLINPVLFFGLLRRLKKYRFELAIDFEQWMRVSSIIAFFSSAKERLGFKTEGQGRRYLFTQTVVHEKERHEVECFLDLLRPQGIETNNRRLELWPAEENIKEADWLLNSLNLRSDFIVLHAEVSETARQRQWPLENFAQVGNELMRRGFRIVIAATSKGRAEAERLSHLLGGRADLLIDVALLTWYVLLPKARLVIVNNTGFMHLAAASGVRVLALHGPVSPVKWGPWGEGHISVKSSSPCRSCVYLGFFEFGCKHNKCMQSITPQEVLAKLSETKCL